MKINNPIEHRLVKSRMDHALATGADKAAQAATESLKDVPKEIVAIIQEAIRDGVNGLREFLDEMIEDARQPAT